MTDTDTLYSELKPDIEAVAGALFDLSQILLQKTDNFLPHGAILTTEGEIKLIGATTGSDYADSTEILPILHEGIRTQVADGSVRAVGVAENVIVTPSGEESTKAVKVLIEHERGLTTALYLPFDKEKSNGYTYGNIFAVSAQPEVNPWGLNPLP